jgi:hypothetical protein
LANSPIGAYLKQLNDAQNSANLANDTRFKQAAQLYSNMGQSEYANVDDYANKTKANTMQSLNARGLANTTVIDAENAGVDRNAQRMKGQVDENLAGGLSDLLGKKEDNAPNPGIFADLIKSAYSSPGPVHTVQTQYFGADGNQYGNMSAALNAPGSGSMSSGTGYNPPAPKAQYIGPRDPSAAAAASNYSPSSFISPQMAPVQTAAQDQNKIVYLNGVPYQYVNGDWVPVDG